MTILDRIKNKAQQALTGIGNFIDRDKEMGGVQLAQGGLGNRVSGFFQDARQKAKDRNNAILNQNVGGYALRDQIKAYPQAFAQNLPFTPERQENFNRNVSDVLGKNNPLTTATQGFNNWLSAPLMQVPYQLKETFAPDKRPLERVGSGFAAAGGLLPGVDDAVFAAYNAVKNKAADRSFKEGLAGNEYAGLGDALTGGQDNSFASILNAAEIPLLVFGGLKAGGVKNVDEALAGVKNMDEVIPAASKEIKEVLALPQPNQSVSVTQLKKLANQGDNLQGVTEVVAKTADDARDALNLGIDASKIKIDDIIQGSKRTLFGTEGGDVLKKLPENQKAFDFAQEAADTIFKPQSKARQAVDYLFVNTAEKMRGLLGDNLYDKHFAPLLDRYTKNLDDAVGWSKAQKENLSNLVNETGIKVGGDEDKLLHLFRKKNGYDEVVNQVGRQRADELALVYDTLRGNYDEMLDFINTQRRSAGLNEIPKKADFLSQLGGKKEGINLAGSSSVTDEVSSSIFKKQTADANSGAIESMVNYIDRARRAAFTDLSGNEVRQFREALAQNKNTPPEILKQLQELETNITGAGKEVSPLQQTIEGVAGKMKGAAVVGKASTLVNQALSLPHGIANSGAVNFAKGLIKGDARKAAEQSQFLKFLADDTPSNLRTGGVYKKGVDKAGDLLQSANSTVAKNVWTGLFEKAKQMQVPDPIKWADDEAARILGDRRAGLSPQVYNTMFGKIAGAFTIEQTAAITSLAQNLGQKKWGTVMGTLLAWKLGNDLNEKYGTGFRPYFDPLDAITDSLELGQGSDTTEQNTVKAILRPLVEATKLAPPISSALFTAYKAGEGVGVLPESRDVFADDPTWMNVGSLFNPFDKWGRNITGNRLVDEPINIASKFLPGVDQGAKTLQAAISQNRGYAETKKGDPMYQMSENPLEAGRALLFGQSATKNARDWFDNDFSGWLSDKQKKAFEKITNKDDQRAFLENAYNKNEKLNLLRSGSARSMDSVISGKGESMLTMPTSKEEATENKSVITELMGNGYTPSKEDISVGLFEGKSATSKSVEERMDVYKALKPIVEDEYMSDEQKIAAIEASGASQENAEYYVQAAKDVDVKTQEILPKIENMEYQEMIEFLGQGRRMIGGKQLVTSGMIDYLYEMDYIGANERKMLKALQYDEIGDKFYFKKSYTGGGSGTISYSKAKKLFDLPELPKFSTLKSVDSLLTQYTPSVGQTGGGSDTLLSSIIESAPVSKNRNDQYWF